MSSLWIKLSWILCSRRFRIHDELLFTLEYSDRNVSAASRVVSPQNYCEYFLRDTCSEGKWLTTLFAKLCCEVRMQTGIFGERVQKLNILWDIILICVNFIQSHILQLTNSPNLFLSIIVGNNWFNYSAKCSVYFQMKLVHLIEKVVGINFHYISLQQ